MTEWYRYKETHWAPPCDENGNCCGEGSTTVHLKTYQVLKETPKGVWIKLGTYFASDAKDLESPIIKKRFILRDARKRFACPTKEEAMISFRARKARQKEILMAQIRRVDRALEAANRVG